MNWIKLVMSNLIRFTNVDYVTMFLPHFLLNEQNRKKVIFYGHMLSIFLCPDFTRF